MLLSCCSPSIGREPYPAHIDEQRVFCKEAESRNNHSEIPVKQHQEKIKSNLPQNEISNLNIICTTECQNSEESVNEELCPNRSEHEIIPIDTKQKLCSRDH